MHLSQKIDVFESIISFSHEYDKKVNKDILNIVQNKGAVISKCPKFIVDPFLKGELTYKYGWDIDYKSNQIVLDQKNRKELKKDIKNKKIHINKAFDTFYSFYSHYAESVYIVKGEFDFKKITPLHIWIYKILKVLIILSLSLFILLLTFLSSSNPINWDLFNSYLHDPIILLFSYIPILTLMVCAYLCTHRLWASFLITEIPFGILAYANFFKLRYRDYPVAFSDLNILSEAAIMAEKYDISPTKWHILFILISIVIILFLVKLFPKKYSNFKMSLLSLVLVISGFSFFVNKFVLNPDIYDIAGNEEVLDNVWIESQQIQRRGVVYAFMYSYNSSFDSPPENYNLENAKNILDQYETQNIPEDQKVNIVSIMLESYNDFTKFNLPFTEDIYAPFHQFQKEGYYGEMASNVFGGGTVNSERSFLAGYFHHPLYLQMTNSYVHYLNSQGYNTVALHPCYGSFYNRRNINQYLGFDEFYYVENRYDEVSFDDVFFPDIINEFEKQVSTGQPYFNFSLNYQGHGPYPTEYNENVVPYLNLTYLREDIFNQVNFYFNWIKNTNNHLKTLHDYFEKSDEPVVLLLYGDHNPVFGYGKEGFELMGINMDTGTQEGFTNYYYTPYVIWSNSAAKKVLGTLPTGKGPTISPNYLMNELFGYLGWQGTDYMQYTNTLKEEIPVLHDVWKIVDGNLVQELDSMYQDKYDEFREIEYYYYTNFNKTN